jgi:predicted ester cyclase
MKNLLFFFGLLFFSCKPSSNDTGQQMQQKGTELTDVELQTKSMIVNYLKVLESNDWKQKLRNYASDSQESLDKFIEEYGKFRTAFPNYKVKIKHIAIDGNEGIAWLTVNAVHAGQFDGNELKGTPATGKNVEWEEVWYFDVVDGKFGTKWDFIDNGVSRMKQLGVKCLPAD